MKILSNMTNQEKISTNSPLDELLDGGIEKRTITQVYGPPGVGKTNVCLNIAINVAKKYEEPETVRFINGVLGSFVRAKEESV